MLRLMWLSNEEDVMEKSTLQKLLDDNALDIGTIILKNEMAVGGFATVYDIGGGEVLKVINCRDMMIKKNVPPEKEKELSQKLFREISINKKMKDELSNSPYLLIADHCFQLNGAKVGDREEKILFLRMKRMNSTLADYLPLATVSEKNILHIAMDIGKAMKAYSTMKIVHRDISPTNIFVTSDEKGGVRYVLGDFGISKEIKSGESNVSSMSRMMNEVYASPEQEHLQLLDIRSDIYSLGLVLSMYISENSSRMEKQKTENFIELMHMIAKMIKVNKDERYQTAEELLQDLEIIRDKQDQEEKLLKNLPEEYQSLLIEYRELSEKYQELNMLKNNLKGKIARLEGNVQEKTRRILQLEEELGVIASQLEEVSHKKEETEKDEEIQKLNEKLARNHSSYQEMRNRCSNKDKKIRTKDGEIEELEIKVQQLQGECRKEQEECRKEKKERRKEQEKIINLDALKNRMKLNPISKDWICCCQVTFMLSMIIYLCIAHVITPNSELMSAIPWIWNEDFLFRIGIAIGSSCVLFVMLYVMNIIKIQFYNMKFAYLIQGISYFLFGGVTGMGIIYLVQLIPFDNKIWNTAQWGVIAVICTIVQLGLIFLLDESTKLINGRSLIIMICEILIGYCIPLALVHIHRYNGQVWMSFLEIVLSYGIVILLIAWLVSLAIEYSIQV